MARQAVTPSLFSDDLDNTIAFYLTELGFRQTGIYHDQGDPGPTWTELSLGKANIWFFANPLGGFPKPAFSGLIYLFVDDVDSYHLTLGASVEIAWGPQSQPYGLRELGIRDCNGYYLVFAQDE